MTRRIERPTSSSAPRALVEVLVRLDGKPYRKVRLSTSPASIGRSDKADVVLDSSHVSRVHAHLHFKGSELRLIDAGSTNGFEIRGRRLRQASINKGDIVDICGFQIEVRWLSLQPTPIDDELSEGWSDLDEDEIPDATFIGESPRPAPDGGRLEPLHQDPTIPVGSMINRLAYRKEELASVIDDEIDPEDLEEYLAPDLPPLLVTLHEEANALLYNEPHAEMSVEVIQVVGGRIYNVDLLAPGEDCWWGGAPNIAEHLWVVPGIDRFPMVTHIGRGEYQVQIPDDPLWKMFQRGQTGVDVHRSGPLVGCQAEPDVQMEITYGPFTHYVRCVRRPPRVNSSMRWVHLRPDRWLIVAALLSTATHAVAMAIPVEPLPVISARAMSADAFVDIIIQTPTDMPVPESREPIPNLSVPPPKVEIAFERIEGSGTAPALEHKRKRKPRRPPPEDLDPEPEPETETNVQLKSISISDFRVAGLIPHLPAVKIDARTGPIMRSGSSMLRGDAARGHGVMTKNGTMALRPHGRLSEMTITRVVNRHAAEIERCYQTALQRQPGLRGRIEVEWIIDKIGVVKTVRITYDDVGAPAIGRCVRASIRTWVFPPPTGGAASVAFPFVFSNLRH